MVSQVEIRRADLDVVDSDRRAIGWAGFYTVAGVWKAAADNLDVESRV
jgi:hypothetical protein